MDNGTSQHCLDLRLSTGPEAVAEECAELREREQIKVYESQAN